MLRSAHRNYPVVQYGYIAQIQGYLADPQLMMYSWLEVQYSPATAADPCWFQEEHAKQ